MAKIGRNQPCPCGSGKKYKHCCLSKDQAARAAAARHTKQHLPRAAPSETGFFLGEDDLDKLSNRVVDLIDEGRLEEAERVCQELKEQYPEVIDWIQRTAMLHEARGETQKAIDYHERTLQYMDAHPEDFEELSRELVRTAIARLQQSPDAPS
ncbi:MAG: SEC-C metal-binding domain-containing protein [Gammaproteobacteria bacterium]|nr:SEC-C metal-binding domain-containing protein [Gammaproteobacteria bacterium]